MFILRVHKSFLLWVKEIYTVASNAWGSAQQRTYCGVARPQYHEFLHEQSSYKYAV